MPRKLEMNKNPYKGKLISLSGIDGSGKSSLMNLLNIYLMEKDFNVIQFKTPSKEIKEYSYQKEYERTNFCYEESQLDLFSLCTISLGDRFLLLRKRIIPHIKKGGIVICDRYVFTAIVEMLAFNLPNKEIKLIESIISRFIEPDLAFFLKVDSEIAFKRIAERNDPNDRIIDQNKLKLSAKYFKEIASTNGYPIISTQSDSINNSFKKVKYYVDNLLAIN